MNLTGHTVLLARDPARAASLRARLESLGARVLVSPVTAVEPGETAALDAAVENLDTFDWVALTSVNAVAQLQLAANRMDTPLATADVQWAAVGPATGAALERIGIKVALIPDDHSAAALVSALATALGTVSSAQPLDGTTQENQAAGTVPAPTDETSPARILLPQSALAPPTLADGLRHLGHIVETVTAYRTVPARVSDEIRQAWAAGRVDVAVLAAASAARELAAQLPPREDVAVVAIGAPTAAAATDAGLRVAAVARSATDVSLTEAILNALSASP